MREGDAKVSRQLSGSVTKGVWLAALLATAGASARDESPNQFEISFQGPVRHFAWEDVDDRVEGIIVAPELREGGEARLTFDIRPFQGKPTEGPAVVTLSRDENTLQSETLIRDKDGYHMVLRLPESGPYTVRIGFTSTRRKMISSFIVAEPSAVPKVYGLAIGGLVALAVAAWFLLENQRARAQARANERERLALLAEPVAPVPPPEN